MNAGAEAENERKQRKAQPKAHTEALGAYDKDKRKTRRPKTKEKGYPVGDSLFRIVPSRPQSEDGGIKPISG